MFGVQIQQTISQHLKHRNACWIWCIWNICTSYFDYRFLTNPSAGTFFTQQAGLSNIDIAKIEVVRGAASALYGPGVTLG